MKTSIVLNEANLGPHKLKNRMVMPPMTRSRATKDHVPTALMTEYYAERASAGLIITEGIAISPNAAGYPRMPGIYNEPQANAWKEITKAVHQNKGKIFAQLMHSGRISHKLNMPEGSEIVAPSPIAPATTEMYTDQKGNQPIGVPKEMTRQDIEQAIEEHVQSAKRAIDSGFDGVELHAANGYLLEQFLNPQANHRDDEYGGSIENRCRLTLEIAKKVSEAIGTDKVGIRLSPGGALNDMGPFEGQQETFEYLVEALNKLSLVYIHLVDHVSMGAPEVPEKLKEGIVHNFKGNIIFCGGFDHKKAENKVREDDRFFIAFGRPFIANPDLPKRFEINAPLNEPKPDFFYAGGREGYTDYPTLEEVGTDKA